MSAVKIHPPVAASALSTTIKHLACNRHNHRIPAPFTSNLRCRGFRRRGLTTIAMSSPNPIEVCGKASYIVGDYIGDCPFTQRVLMTLEEKHLPYDLKLVDLRNKPEWFLNISPEGKVPVAKLDDKWIADSDVITQLIEEKFPDPPLVVPPEKASVGSKIFSAFIGFLKSKDPDDGTEQALVNELSAFNDYIKENGPFINGKGISAADLSLGPKLYHMKVALFIFKEWPIPDSLPHLTAYMKTIFSLDSFIKTKPLMDDVKEGWRPKVMQLSQLL